MKKIILWSLFIGSNAFCSFIKPEKRKIIGNIATQVNQEALNQQANRLNEVEQKINAGTISQEEAESKLSKIAAVTENIKKDISLSPTSKQSNELFNKAREIEDNAWALSEESSLRNIEGINEEGPLTQKYNQLVATTEFLLEEAKKTLKENIASIAVFKSFQSKVIDQNGDLTQEAQDNPATYFKDAQELSFIIKKQDGLTQNLIQKISMHQDKIRNKDFEPLKNPLETLQDQHVWLGRYDIVELEGIIKQLKNRVKEIAQKSAWTSNEPEKKSTSDISKIQIDQKKNAIINLQATLMDLFIETTNNMAENFNADSSWRKKTERIQQTNDYLNRLGLIFARIEQLSQSGFGLKSNSDFNDSVKTYENFDQDSKNNFSNLEKRRTKKGSVKKPGNIMDLHKTLSQVDTLLKP